MNHTAAPTADVGVLVARFQVAELSPAHTRLIEHVLDRHNKVIVILGVAPLATSFHNPLDFEARKQMLLASYPKLNVLYLKDINNDLAWSKALDTVIRDVLSPVQTAVLYGSRDSFIPSYLGRHDTIELPSFSDHSGTEIRAALAQEAKDSPEWRAGVIWASRNRFPVSYTCVDIAVFSEDRSRILLGHKPNETAWRLPGGFTDPGSKSLEEDAARELQEETGLHIGTGGGSLLTYMQSFSIDDWRYCNEPDSIKTTLFCARVIGEVAVEA